MTPGVAPLRPAGPGDVLAGIAHGVLDQVAEDFRRPAYRAGFGASLVTAAVLARLGSRMSVAVAGGVLVGLSVERLFEMAEEIHASVTDADREV